MTLRELRDALGREPFINLPDSATVQVEVDGVTASTDLMLRVEYGVLVLGTD